jgi:hypothetical protein
MDFWFWYQVLSTLQLGSSSVLNHLLV